jgi:hypothetical protein
MPRIRTLWLAIGLVMLGAMLGACGGDDDDSADAGEDEDKAQPCGSPGFTETGCVCTSGALGRRVCQEDHTWESCKCPPATQQCVQGQDVECYLCPGESKPRITKCLQGGTFDCSCGMQSGSSGGGG